MSLKQIKNKIRSIEKTHKVTKAMESVSAVKMRKSQAYAMDMRDYAISAFRILGNLSRQHLVAKNIFLRSSKSKKTCFIVITSDRGLAGNLNSILLKSISMYMDREGLSPENTSIIALGRKGYDFFKRRDYKVELYLNNISDDVSLNSFDEILQKVEELFREGKYGRFVVSYTNFINTTKYSPDIRLMLPISFEQVKEVIEDLVPNAGKYSDSKSNFIENIDGSYIFEPDEQTLIDSIIPILLKIQLFFSLLESKASEHSARMVAMKNASEKADEIVGDLNLEFNKQRQAQITREISEIVSGMGS